MGSKGKKKQKHKLNKKKETVTNSAEKDTLQEEENYENVDEQDAKPQANSKRPFSGDDSDNDDQPQKKKKKKKPLPNASTDSKGKSIRQMKREKHAQRIAEIAAASKDQLKAQCISYLSQWKHNRDNWKFMKAKQVWLYKNKFSSYLLPDSSWPVFLEYFESAKGNIRNMLLEDANKVIKEMDEWTESQNKSKTDEEQEQENNDGPKKPDDIAYKRARDLIQCLQE